MMLATTALLMPAARILARTVSRRLQGNLACSEHDGVCYPPQKDKACKESAACKALVCAAFAMVPARRQTPRAPHPRAVKSMVSELSSVRCRICTRCASALVCKTNGKCDATEVCTSTAGCAATEDCKRSGLCAAKNGRCVATNEGCKASLWCARNGTCSAKGGKCIATAESCRASINCKVKTVAALLMKVNACSPKQPVMRSVKHLSQKVTKAAPLMVDAFRGMLNAKPPMLAVQPLPIAKHLARYAKKPNARSRMRAVLNRTYVEGFCKASGHSDPHCEYKL